MRVIRILITLVVLLMMSTRIVHAGPRLNPFDNDRKGFIASLGFGPSVTSISSEYRGLEGKISKGAIGIDFRLGYAPDNRWQFFFAHKASVYASKYREHVSDYLDNVNVKTKDGIGLAVITPIVLPVIVFFTDQHLMMGVGVSYYFEPRVPSWFVDVGIGISDCADPYERAGSPFPRGRPEGYGAFGGIGYEFADHWRAECQAMWSMAKSTKGGYKKRWSALSAMLIIQVLGY